MADQELLLSTYLRELWTALRTDPAPANKCSYGPILFEHVITEYTIEKHHPVVHHSGGYAGGHRSKRERTGEEYDLGKLPSELSEGEKAALLEEANSHVKDKMVELYGKETLNKTEALAVLSALQCAPTQVEIDKIPADGIDVDTVKQLVTDTRHPEDTAEYVLAFSNAMNKNESIPHASLKLMLMLGENGLTSAEVDKFIAKTKIPDPCPKDKLAKILLGEE